MPDESGKIKYNNHVIHKNGDVVLIMAEAFAQPMPQARPIGGAGFSNASSQLQRGRMAARRSRAPQRRLTTGVRPINAERLNPITASDEERRQLDQQHKTEYLRKRIETMRQMQEFQQPTSGQTAVAAEPELQQQADETQQIQQLMAQDQALTFENAQRWLLRRRINSMRQAAANRQRQQAKEMADKAIKKMKEWIWRGASPGSTTEWEGATAWIWSIIGYIMFLLNLVTTIFQTSTRGEFIKGPLAFLAPPGFDLKDPATWTVDFAYGIAGGLILLTIVVIIHVFVIIIAAIVGLTILGFKEIIESIGFSDLVSLLGL